MCDSSKPRAVIASGAGRYADPWHTFSETSPAIAQILRLDGWQVEVVEDVDAALAALDGVDVLVINAGDPWRGEDAMRGASPAAERGLADAISRGIGLVGLHCALSSLRDYPAWRSAIGGEWEPGHSWHPELGESLIHATDIDTETALVGNDFTVFDERYTDLIVDPGAEVHAEHILDGVHHPVIWTRELVVGSARARAAVSTLGHGVQAYESIDYRTALVRLIRWAARRTPHV